MSEIQGRLHVINAKLQAELITLSRLKDAAGKAIVLIWMGAAVFFGFMLSEPTMKLTDLVNQESSYVPR
ncbi:hypothetical protein GFL93_12600 [Rhizobium leguminosarum bv. viciae]|uniref:hypothetical protein n=1 Tax=Rhizobium TaxID=379 RepID=UPI0014425929|nr:hypothetical protein [Rhizobium leguminosarum]NKK06700.1 hypothetical protein [Rhizobium leguminosarum bv. viciae]